MVLETDCVCSVCPLGARGAEQVMVPLTPRQLRSKKSPGPQASHRGHAANDLTFHPLGPASQRFYYFSAASRALTGPLAVILGAD